MKKSVWVGLLGVFLISCIPIVLWWILGEGAAGFTDYAQITQSLGELAGLVAMTMFALTFMLSTRIKWIEDVFGGLDKVYVAHGVLGGSALILILSHPLLLVLKFVPDNMKQAALYLLPSSYWSVNFGIIALLGLIFLVAITLFAKIRYQRWKFTHTFMGLVFMFAVLHVFLVRGEASQDLIFDGYYAYALVVSAIGLFGFGYTLFLKTRWFKSAPYTVVSVKETGKDIFEITMRAGHKPIGYTSGQFVFVRFYNTRLPKEPHPFSIASKSNDPLLRIVVKNLGDFTSRLSHVQPSDKVAVEGPYGRFNVNPSERPAVWIGGGIGIVPFLAMAQDLPADKKVDLYYAVNSEKELAFIDELRSVASRRKNLRVIPWTSSNKGYLTSDMIAKYSGPLNFREYFLCGPDGLKKSIVAGLHKAGLTDEFIHQEEFNFK